MKLPFRVVSVKEYDALQQQNNEANRLIAEATEFLKEIKNGNLDSVWMFGEDHELMKSLVAFQYHIRKLTFEIRQKNVRDPEQKENTNHLRDSITKNTYTIL